MTLIKSLLLGSTAGLLAVAGAQAADLPVRKAAPVEYVRICDAFGAGFFFVPGTDTCLRIGGYARADYQYVPGRDVYSTAGLAANGFRTQVAGAQTQYGMEFRGRIEVDSRTQSPWGTVQAVARLRMTNSEGIRAGSGLTTNGVAYTSTGAGSAQGTTLERAFIRFAGFTFGVADSNFTTFPSNTLLGDPTASFPSGIGQLAYTATFGGGFSATIALESHTAVGGSATTQGFMYTHHIENSLNIVGNVRLDQSWGYAQISGAVGQNTVGAGGVAVAGGGGTGIAGAPAYNALVGKNSTTAWAVGFGAQIKLPMLAAGDNFNFWAAYAEGMTGMVGCDNFSSCSDSSNRRTLGGVMYNLTNAILVSTTLPGQLGVPSYSQTKSWTVVGQLQHFWTPQLRSAFTTGYNEMIVPTAAASAGLQIGSSSLWMASANLIWSPIRRLDLGVEVAYYQNNVRYQNAPAAFVAAGSPGTGRNTGWAGKMRVERQF